QHNHQHSFNGDNSKPDQNNATTTTTTTQQQQQQQQQQQESNSATSVTPHPVMMLHGPYAAVTPSAGGNGQVT
ncbi:MAG: hypothetical protein N6V41_01575, partial [Candidatus Portiera aleyrodidarum]|nr:hypothetical protein [Candidatus Portiera aleyrodidarum]